MKPLILNNSSVRIEGDNYWIQTADKFYSIDLDEVRTYEVRTGDRWKNDGSAKKLRSEICGQKKYDFNKPIRVTFKQLLHAGPSLTTRFAVVGQFHQSEAQGELGAPPFAIYIERNAKGQEEYAITINTSTQEFVNKFIPPVYVARVPVVRGIWREWDITYVDGCSKGGSLVVKLDGVVVASYKGPTGYIDIQGVYWKEGIYLGDEGLNGEPLPSGFFAIASYKDLRITQ